jgi:hypothetical protein
MVGVMQLRAKYHSVFELHYSVARFSCFLIVFYRHASPMGLKGKTPPAFQKLAG